MDFSALIALVFGNQYARILVYLLLSDLAVGIAVAIIAGQFDLTKTADWLKQLFSLYLGYGSVVLLAYALPDVEASAHITTIAFATVVATVLGSILGNLKVLGFNLPVITPPASASPKT